MLGTSEGVDRAFRKLDQLKPYIVWWQDDFEAAHILATGDVLMTSASAPSITVINRNEHRNFGLHGQPVFTKCKAGSCLKGSPKSADGDAVAVFHGTPAIEGRLVLVSGDGGLAKGANEWPNPEVAQISPTTPANLSAAVRIDSGFWHDNLPKLRQRFESWLTH